MHRRLAGDLVFTLARWRTQERSLGPRPFADIGRRDRRVLRRFEARNAGFCQDIPALPRGMLAEPARKQRFSSDLALVAKLGHLSGGVGR